MPCPAAIDRAVPILRKLTAILFVLLATLAFSLPAAASIAHDAGHPPVAGGIEAHFHFVGDNQESGDRDSSHDVDDRSAKDGVGHSHPPLSLADPGLLPSNFLVLPAAGAHLPQEWSVKSLPTRAWTPHERPPRA